MPTDDYRKERPEIDIGYHRKGQLLNIWRMKASSRASKASIHDLLFLGERALDTMTEAAMHKSVDRSAAGCAKFGLAVNAEKTVVVHQPVPNVEYRELTSPSMKLA
nr:unnamed protein product [Spirometra erinaceieuropaei]